MTRTTTIFNYIIFTFCFMVSTIGFSQEKKKHASTKDSNSAPYSSDIGRMINAEVAKKYMAAFPDYEKKLTLSKDKKTYVDKNDLSLMVKLQRTNKIEDKVLTELLTAPENQQLVKDLHLNNGSKPEAPLIATPTLESK